MGLAVLGLFGRDGQKRRAAGLEVTGAGLDDAEVDDRLGVGVPLRGGPDLLARLGDLLRRGIALAGAVTFSDVPDLVKPSGT